MRKNLTSWFSFATVLLPLAAVGFPGETDTNLASLAELQKAIANQGCLVESFRLEGVVCAVVPERNMIALQDDSATALLELPKLDGAIHVGDRLAIEGNRCTLVRTWFGIRLGTEVVNNDGQHSPIVRTGRVYLDAGRQPIRVEWFNAIGTSELNVEYEGPRLPRQRIPANALFWKPPGQSNFDPGVHFSAYVQNDIQIQQGSGMSGRPYDGWQALPDFARLQPVREGLATNFDDHYRTRDEYAALVFSGYLQVFNPGVYKFYLESDDGSRLYLGDPSARCTIATRHNDVPPAIVPWEHATSSRAFQWTWLSGTVLFVGKNAGETELEVSTDSGLAQLSVPGDPAKFSPKLLNQHIDATGVCERSPDGEALMIAPSWEQIKISNPTNTFIGSITNTVLTSAGQVRQLKFEQAQRQILTKLRGVVIWATMDGLVLQDVSGGVFVHWFSEDMASHPRVGELWEIQGRTDPGDFSPVVVATNVTFVARVPMPDPIRPSWDQLMNGSLDAEYVEVRGVVTSASDSEMTLLTPDGEVIVEGDNERPLPHLARSVSTERSLAGSLVRMRGCYTADWNYQTRQVNGGRFKLCPALVEVEEPAPADPFALPATTSEDLLRFNAHASALQHTKVAGQIIYARSGEYFLLDGKTGVRVLTAQSSRAGLRAGDLVQAVGFPKLGGPSAVLQNAEIKVVGHAALPEPVHLSNTNLLDDSYDSTLVQVEALLISDTVHQSERELELQGGDQHFAAILNTDPRTWTSYRPGTKLQLTGVYASEGQGSHEATLYPFKILLNNAAGIAVLQRPSWWTVRHAVIIAAALGTALGVAFIWITLLQRKVEQRTAQLQEEIEARQLAEQHRAVDQERTRVARDLHDELGAGLTELGILGELGNNPAIPSEEKGQYLVQLTGLTRTLVSGLDEIVWATNPHYDSLGSMTTYFSFFADRFLKLAGIACRLRVAEDFPEHPVNSQIRHGVFLVLKEALNNVVRHAEATEVELSMQAEGDELAISIRDNGRGMTPASAAPPGSDGLTGVRERLQQFGGSCSITSSPGKGTTVEFRLPLKPLAATHLKALKMS